MCLTTVTKTYDKPFTPKNNIGYVAINKSVNGTYFGIRYGTDYKKGRFYGAKGYRSMFKSKYKIGFHIWKFKKDAEQCREGDMASVVVRVKYKNVLARGAQSPLFEHWGDGKPVIVAHDRMIIKEVKP